MKKIVIPVCLAAFLTFVACNSGPDSDNDVDSATTDISSTADTNTMANTDTMAADKEFIMEAASGGLMEVELGKVASANAAAPKVKEFGRMMVTDHSKANTELKAIAAKKNITVPATPAEEQQKHIDELNTKKGADFDKGYVDMMVDDHKEVIDKFEDEAKNGKDADVKAFASKTLPVLQKHLASIKSIQDGMKK